MSIRSDRTRLKGCVRSHDASELDVHFLDVVLLQLLEVEFDFAFDRVAGHQKGASKVNRDGGI